MNIPSPSLELFSEIEARGGSRGIFIPTYGSVFFLELLAAELDHVSLHSRSTRGLKGRASNFSQIWKKSHVSYGCQSAVYGSVTKTYFDRLSNNKVTHAMTPTIHATTRTHTV